ncbi:hypothetical protein CZ809_00429 [Photobacterium piscicola]|uniref:O-Antigen ligase n=2 Tax=Photobacterium piscicola TaxID=1378299 RepID=A0A1T5HW51_9GAMM|nr:hypothetical protein CZ809_00429 [Photobacterium piscicola]
MVFKYLTIIFISINVVCYCIIKNIDLFDFLRSFIVVSAILASFCIGEYFSPYIKHMISTYFISTDNIIYSETFRVKGFVSGGGAKLSFCLALAVMFSHALYVEKKNNLLILLSLIISVGALLVGRTGMVLTFISWFALLAITIGKPTIKSVSILTLVIVIILVGINNLDFSSDELKMVHQYSFELLYNYQETGKFSSKSTDAISNMYIMPNWNVILFGNGTFSYDGIINVIDVGYYKQLFSTGIIGFFLFYFSIGWGQYVSYKYICLNVNKVFCFIIFVSFWVVEAKEPIFLHGYSSRVLLMVFLFSVLDGRIINNEKK